MPNAARPRVVSWMLAASLALCAAVAAGRPSNAAPATTPDLGLAIGQRAPAFILRAQDGRRVALDSLRSRGPVALVFSRSADWCLYCKMQLVQLQEHVDEIEAAGGRIASISYDSVDQLERFAARRTITFPLLSDPGSRTIDAYHVRSTGEPGRTQGIASHVTFIVDGAGVIREKLFHLSYAERPALDDLVQALKAARNPNPGEIP